MLTTVLPEEVFVSDFLEVVLFFEDLFFEDDEIIFLEVVVVCFFDVCLTDEDSLTCDSGLSDKTEVVF